MLKIVIVVTAFFLFCAKSKYKSIAQFHENYFSYECIGTQDMFGNCYFLDEDTGERIYCWQKKNEECSCQKGKLYDLKKGRTYKLGLYYGRKKVCQFNEVRMKDKGELHVEIQETWLKVELKPQLGQEFQYQKCSYCLRAKKSGKCYREAKGDSVCKKFYVFGLQSSKKYELAIYNQYKELLHAKKDIATEIEMARVPFVLFEDANILLEPYYDSNSGIYNYYFKGLQQEAGDFNCYFKFHKKGKLTDVICNMKKDKTPDYICSCQRGIFKNLEDESILAAYDSKRRYVKEIKIPKINFNFF